MVVFIGSEPFPSFPALAGKREVAEGDDCELLGLALTSLCSLHATGFST